MDAFSEVGYLLWRTHVAPGSSELANDFHAISAREPVRSAAATYKLIVVRMSPGRWRRVVVAAVGLHVLTVAVIAYVAPAFGHRLGRPESLNGATLNPPSFWTRPH